VIIRKTIKTLWWDEQSEYQMKLEMASTDLKS
jgi:hypothetical protein